MSKNHDRIQSLFLGALNVAADERDAWLIEQCGNQPDVLKEVRALLEHANPSADPLEQGLNADIGPMADVRNALITSVTQDSDHGEIQRDSPNTGGVSGDRNLLFGILALQSGLISEQQLVAAMKEWTFRKNVPLSGILQQQEVMTESICRRLNQMVDLHIGLHNNDVAQSINSLSGISGVALALSEMGDPEIQASVANLRANPSHDPRLESTFIGNSTSSGMRFRVLRPHAKGGLGEVFVAHDAELNRDVALKEIQQQHAGNSDTRSRFRMEAEITGALEHPGIVPVYGLGAYEDGRPFYAMRFVRGDSLKEAIRQFHGANLTESERNLGFRDLLNRFIDVCQAVEYAHSRGVLHRDLKPGNIMLGRFGETLVVDWGLSRATGRAESAIPDSSMGPIQPQSGSDVAMTQDGSVIGTVQYMSPEQAAGRLDQLGPATDVYSLGAILYELLTGRPPIEWEKCEDGQPDIGATLKLVREGIIQTPQSIRPEVAKPLQAVCLKALSHNPQDRYASVAELAEDIGRWLADEPVNAWPEPLTIRTRRWIRKHQTLVSTTAVAVVVAAAALSGILAIVTDANRQLEAANTRIREEETKVRKERDIAMLVNEFVRDDILAKSSPYAEPDRNIRLRTVLERAAEGVNERFAETPEMEAPIQELLGETFQALGEFKQSEQHLMRAGKLWQDQPDNPNLLRNTNQIALLYKATGRYTEARPLFESALEEYRRVLGDDHPETLGVQDNLAGFYAVVDRRDIALPLMEKTLKDRQRILGPEHHDTLISTANLASIYNGLGRDEDAHHLIEAVQRDLKARIGHHHPQTMIATHNLAHSSSIQGSPDYAESMLKELLPREAKILGVDHPLTLSSQHLLAEIYWKQNKREEAIELCLSTLETRKRVLGDEHPDTLTTLALLAEIYETSEDFEKALPLLEKALAGRLKALGEEHADTVVSMQCLSGLYGYLGRFSDAEPLLLRSLAICEKQWGEAHPKTFASVNNLGDYYRAKGQYDLARPYLEKNVRMCRQVRGPDHRETIWSINRLAMLCYEQGDYVQSLALYEEAGELETKRYGRDSPEVIQNNTCIATCWLELGQTDKALKLSKDLVDRSNRHLGPTHSVTMDAQQGLLSAYIIAADYSRAAPLAEQTVEVTTAALGSDHPTTLSRKSTLALVYKNLGQTQRARQINEEVLQSHRRIFGDNHPATLASLSSVAWIGFEQGQIENAQSLLEQVLATRRQVLGSMHPVTLSSIRDVAVVMEQRGLFKNAEPLRHEAVECSRQQNVQQLILASALAELGNNLLEQSRFDDAEAPCRECVEIRAKLIPDSWVYFNAQGMLGSAILGQGRAADAEPLILAAYNGVKARIDQMAPANQIRLRQAIERAIEVSEILNKDEFVSSLREELLNLGEPSKSGDDKD